MIESGCIDWVGFDAFVSEQRVLFVPAGRLNWEHELFWVT